MVYRHKHELSQAARILVERGWVGVTGAALRQWETRDELMRFEKRNFPNPRLPNVKYFRVVSWSQIDICEKILVMKHIGYSTAQIQGYFKMPEGEERTKITANIVNRAMQLVNTMSRSEDIMLRAAEDK